jgi:AcrR family transcriptional regulator
MTAGPEPRKKRRPDRLDRILAAAVDLFDAKGYARTSMEEIAAAVGLTAGAIYQHFRDKQAILDAALDAAARRLVDALRGEADQDPPARLLTLVDRVVEVVTTDTALMSVARHDQPLAGFAAQAHIRDAEVAVAAELLRALSRCRPDLPIALAEVTVHAALGAAYSPTHTASGLPPARRAALLSGGILAALLGDPA